MKVKYLFKIAALLLVAALSSCSSDELTETGVDTDTPQRPITFTTTIGQKGAGTRALAETEDGKMIDAYWELGEEVAVVSDGGQVLCIAKVTAADKSRDGGATISGPVESGVSLDGVDGVKLIYPASAVDRNTGDVKADLLNNSQTGTLKDIADYYDVAIATGTLQVDNSRAIATLAEQARFENQYAICKFEFPDLKGKEVVGVVIAPRSSDGQNTVVNLETASNEVYVAMAPFTRTGLDFKVTTMEGDDYKTYSAAISSATVEASLYYRVELSTEEVKVAEAVDLGLPSGTLWASWNIGATTETDYGLYFAWGETKGYKKDDGHVFDWHNYKYGIANASSTNYHVLTKYCTESEHGYNGFTDGLTTLQAIDDAATVNWGSSWCMPSKEQLGELVDSRYTTKQWTKYNGVDGLMITSITNKSKFIFLPATTASSTSVGGYWSTEMEDANDIDAAALEFSEDYLETANSPQRDGGLCIRAVRKK